MSAPYQYLQSMRDGGVATWCSWAAQYPRHPGRGASTLHWSAFYYCDQTAEISTLERLRQDCREFKVSVD